MRLRLVHLVLAVLVLLIAATVFATIMHNKQVRHREAMLKIIDDTAAKLKLPPDVLYANRQTRQRLRQIHKWMFQQRSAQDPSRQPAMNAPDDEEGDFLPEEDTNSPTGGGIFGGVTSQPTSLPADEVAAMNEDAADILIRQATQACADICGWFETPGDPVGEFLRKHPDVFQERLLPHLQRLLKAANPKVWGAASQALFAQGDRSQPTAEALARVIGQSDNEAGIDPLLPIVEDEKGENANDQWKAAERFVKAMGIPLPLDDPYAKLPVYDDGGRSAATSKETLLPPGAMFLLGDTRFRHNADITSVDFSPNGATLASTAGDTVYLWDVATGKLKTHVRLKDSWPLSVVFASNAQVAVLGSRLWLWDIDQADAHLVGPKDAEYWSIAVSADRKTLAASERSKAAVQLFELPSFKFLHKIVQPPSLAPQTKPSTDGEQCVFEDERSRHDGFDYVQFSVDGKILVCCVQTGANPLRMYDVSTGKLLHEFPELASIALTAAGRLISDDGTQRQVIDIRTGKKEKPLPANLRVDLGTRNGDFFVVESLSDNTHAAVVWLMDGKTLKLTSKLNLESHTVFALSPDGALAAGIDGNCIKLFDLRKNQWCLESRQPLTLLATNGHILYAATDRPNISVDDGRNETLRVWDLGQKIPLPSPLPESEKFRYAAASAFGNILATYSRYESSDPPMCIKLWELAEGKAKFKEKIPRQPFYKDDSTSNAMPKGLLGRLVLSPDGRALACLTKEDVWLWDTGTKELLFRTPGKFPVRPGLPEQKILPNQNQGGGGIFGGSIGTSFNSGIPTKQSIALSAVYSFGDNSLLDGEALLGLGTLTRVSMPNGPREINPLIPAQNLALSTDELMLATEGDGTITIWRMPNIERHIPVRQFPAPRGMDRAGGETIAWLTNAYLLVACDRQNELLIYDVDTCKSVARLRIPSPVVSFISDSAAVYTSHADSTVIAWNFVEIADWCNDLKEHQTSQPNEGR